MLAWSLLLSLSAPAAEPVGQDLMLVVDRSLRVGAYDLRVLRTMLSGLVDHLDPEADVRVGVIAFAGRAHLVQPLTLDHDAVLDTLGDLSVRPGGADLSSALELSALTFEGRAPRTRSVLVVTEGLSGSGACQMYDVLRDVDARAWVLGFGEDFDADAVDCLVQEPLRDVVALEELWPGFGLFRRLGEALL